MFKRFRKSANQNITIAEDSSSNSSGDENNADMQKYVRIQRLQRFDKSLEGAAIISDSSSDEQLPASQEQENRRCLRLPRRDTDKPKAVLLTPTNKFQPLCITLSGKRVAPRQSPSKTPLFSNLDTSNICATTSSQAWHSLRSTLSTIKRQRRSVLQLALEETFVECSTPRDIEANLRTLVDRQQMPASSKSTPLRKPQRCIKGGYLQEYKRLMQKQRMDRRSLNHNQRLGISPGQRVIVLGICESFGVHMVRVQAAEGDDTIFNIIVAACMAAKISIGSFLELYFDLKYESTLMLTNRQLVYVQPNKLVLL